MAVLGLLKEQDMHGYELKKRLSDVFGLASAVSFGSLYPALARLEAAGAVRVVKAEAETDRAAPALPARRRPNGGRAAGGRSTGSRLLGPRCSRSCWPDSQSGGEDERSFNLRLAFARYLPPERRLGLLEQRRAVLGERLAQLAARARARRDDRYMRILAERQHDSLSRDVSWLDRPDPGGACWRGDIGPTGRRPPLPVQTPSGLARGQARPRHPAGAPAPAPGWSLWPVPRSCSAAARGLAVPAPAVS